VVAFVVAVALTYERFTLSRVSYTLIFHFPCLHEVRARLLELLPAARPRHHPPVPRRKSRLLRTNNPTPQKFELVSEFFNSSAISGPWSPRRANDWHQRR
jgi:hypothetical protein